MRGSAFARLILSSPLCWLGGMLFASDAKEPSLVVATRDHEQAIRMKRLETILADVKEKIGKKRKELAVMAEAFGTDDPLKLDLEQQDAIDFHKQLSSELSQVRDEQSEAESRLKALNSKVVKSDEKPNTVEPRNTAPKPAKSVLVDSFDGPGQQPDKIKRDPQDKHEPELKDQAARPGKLIPETRTKTFLTRQLELLSEHESLLVEEMNGLKEDIKSFGRASIELQMKRKEIENLDPIYRNLAEEIERTKVELKSNLPK